MNFSRIAQIAVVPVLLVAALAVAAIGLSSHLQTARATAGSAPVSSPSLLPDPSSGGPLAQARQMDSIWAYHTFSGYSSISAPVQTATGWTFTLRSSGEIYSPAKTDLCTNPSLNGSTYTVQLYGHVVTVKVGLPTASHGSRYTVVTRPEGTRKATLSCS